MQPEEADANELGFDPFDVTKVWPRARFPVRIWYKLDEDLLMDIDARVRKTRPQQKS
jgi:hypothetical protein